MRNWEENIEKLVQYLFGELGAAERDAFEESVFADEDLSIYLQGLEQDLIDEYVAGKMEAGLRVRFEDKYLTTPARRERVRIAATLREQLFEERPSAVVPAETGRASFLERLAGLFTVWNPALAAGLAILLVLTIGGWLVLRSTQDRKEIVLDNRNVETPVPTPVSSPQTTPSTDVDEPKAGPDDSGVEQPGTKPANGADGNKSNEKKPKENGNRVSQPEPRVFVATLLPITRSGERPVLDVPADAAAVRLSVVHDNQAPYVRYRAELRNAAGREIVVREVRADGRRATRPVVLDLAPSQLPSGSYEVILSGINEVNGVEPIKFYNFSVIRR